MSFSRRIYFVNCFERVLHHPVLSHRDALKPFYFYFHVFKNDTHTTLKQEKIKTFGGIYKDAKSRKQQYRLIGSGVNLP